VKVRQISQFVASNHELLAPFGDKLKLVGQTNVNFSAPRAVWFRERAQRSLFTIYD